MRFMMIPIIFMDKLSNTKAGKISKAEIMRKYTMSRDSERRDNIEGFIKGYFAGEVTEDTSILDVAEDSLSMFRLIGAIHKQFGIKMGILDLTRCETIHDLCDYINKLSGREIPVEKITCENQIFCTSIQEAYILGRQQEFYGNTNMSHFYLEVKHNLSSQKIEEAIRKLIRRHSMLRSIFENSRRVVLGEDIADTFFLKTLEEKSLKSHRKAANQKVNEPDKWPLFEICNIKEGDSYIAAIDIDMLIVDGFSLSVLVRDFKSLCRGLELEPISDGFGKYLEAYSIRKSGNRYLQDKQYWLERVKTLPGSPQIPILAAVNRGPNVFLRKEKAFTEKAWEELENVAERNGVTISVLLLTLYIHTLKRWSEEPEFTLNVTVMDRPTQMKDTERFVGDFTTNTLFNYENESGSPRNLYQDLSHVKGRLYEYLDHNNFDGVEVIREYAKVHQGEMALMPVVFTSMLFKEDNALTYEDSDIERSIAQMLERHEVLRSIFLKNGTQKILADVPEYKVDITIAETEQEFAEKNEQMRRELSHKNYDFSKWPLFTFEVLKRGCDDFKILCASINLMVCDGDSLRIFLKEFTEGLNNKKLPPIHYSYHEYVNSLNDSTNEREYQEAKAYWLNKIPCFPEFPHLPMLKNLTQCKNYRISRVSETIDAETWGTFKNTVRKHAVSPSTVLCTIYARVLAKWSNQKDLLLNMTAFERKEFDQNVSGILGDFTKILPLEVHIDGADFWDNAMQIQTRILNNLDHKAFDGTEIIRELSRLSNGIGKALMPVVFTCVLFDSDENWFEQIGKLRYAVTQTPQVFLDNQILEMKHELYISWDYVEDLFNPAIIAAVFEDFISGIKNIAVNGVFETGSQIETDKVWDGYNMPVERVARNTLQAFFEKQVRETPDGTALYYGDKQYTYAAIEAKANQVARYLCSHGICGANNRVGVLGERKPETIISIIGVLKTGAAYVPVDAKFPKERRDFILVNSGSRLLLSEELYRSGELEQYDESPIGIQSLPDSLAYIIYTSGSTGKPKGVMINHMAACNTISDLNNKIKLNKTDRLIGISSVCFDLSVYDIFGAFSTGAALVMVRDARDCSEIVSLLAERKITVWNSVPVICSIVVQHMLERGMKDSLSLRQIMLSGDWIPLDLPDKAKSIFNKTKIMSLGGATEASIWSIYYEIGEVKPAWKSIPYGMPLKNQTMYVLNFAGELCPMDVVGEIYIGGVGVAQGYCGDTEKTEAAFIQHDHLGRIYKTGDMGVLRKEGYIEFLGRIDNQVKIRGYRIELGEIESAINNVPGIEKSVVSYVVNRTGNKQLIAYYIPTSNDLALETIKESIGAFLPEYMVPQHYISIKELPLSANANCFYQRYWPF